MRVLRGALQLPPENNDKIYESHINKKTVFPKKYKKKKEITTTRNKQTSQQPTETYNNLFWIGGVGVGEKSQQTDASVWRSTRNVVFIFLWSVEKAKILRNTRQNGNGTHGVWISRAVKRNCRNETYDGIVAARLIGSLNQPVLLPGSRAENTHDSHIHTHTNTHAHRNTVKRAHIHSEVAGSTRRDTLPAANTETDCICRCFGLRI